ncbi:hypothetical protein Pcinc_010345 [Petrolisthes cinctipes]|uniref:Uncharacterized protein n=1 Tax=Petrolisthes cinctipes TaxID=88211 RepID=A0AAE1KUL1_PETCI|nr:hypothetical protein Pcinc_010345 [Petrolisthes cinctipes]
MKQRLLDVALKRRRTEPLLTTSVKPSNVQKLDDTTIYVKTEKGDTRYDVDLQLGLCDCHYVKPAPCASTSNAAKECVADLVNADRENSFDDFVVSLPNHSSSRPTTDNKQEIIQLLSEAFERFSDDLSSSAVTVMAKQLR